MLLLLEHHFPVRRVAVFPKCEPFSKEYWGLYRRLGTLGFGLGKEDTLCRHEGFVGDWRGTLEELARIEGIVCVKYAEGRWDEPEVQDGGFPDDDEYSMHQR